MKKEGITNEILKLEEALEQAKSGSERLIEQAETFMKIVAATLKRRKIEHFEPFMYWNSVAWENQLEHRKKKVEPYSKAIVHISLKCRLTDQQMKNIEKYLKSKNVPLGVCGVICDSISLSLGWRD